MREWERWMPLGLAALIVVLALATPTLARGAAIYEAYVEYNEDSTDATFAASDWKYQVSDGLPSDGEACLADGTAVPYDIVSAIANINVDTGDEGDDQSPANFDVFSLDPPFSGSSSSTEYLTVCYDTSDYVVIEMTIDLTDCVLWVCTATFTSTVVAEAGSGYSLSSDSGYLTYSIGVLDISVPQLGD